MGRGNSVFRFPQATKCCVPRQIKKKAYNKNPPLKYFLDILGDGTGVRFKQVPELLYPLGLTGIHVVDKQLELAELMYAEALRLLLRQAVEPGYKNCCDKPRCLKSASRFRPGTDFELNWACLKPAWSNMSSTTMSGSSLSLSLNEFNEGSLDGDDIRMDTRCEHVFWLEGANESKFLHNESMLRDNLLALGLDKQECSSLASGHSL
ncbi:hypothetical protein BpHYR1_015284 [Brachionus plicatilis]|uniref:Uncharacterized protein n=1 Tax=Brachionus plicatilis TaxID=10195 RepID=A0A3M7QRP1_BRAPC|nr:hypothetical protein BpHYR1_015284 [Brachionus plicatilis]